MKARIKKEEKLLLEKELKSLIGDKAYRYLKRGGTLNCWRRSSPHNWFIETKKYDMLWHSEDYYPDRILPNLKLFRKVWTSPTRMLIYWGADSGMPEEVKYKLIGVK